MADHADIDHTGITGCGAGEFATQVASVATAQTTTSGTFADLSTPGPSVTVTVPASGKVKLTIYCWMQNTSGANTQYVGVDISGANTVAAASILIQAAPASSKLDAWSATKLLTGLSPGSTTFKMQYATSSGTAEFQQRQIIVEPVL